AKENYDMEIFTQWRRKIIDTGITLIKGNHDILPKYFYDENKIEDIKELFLTENIKLVHRFNGVAEENIFTISGHVHPAVRLHGKGKQKNAYQSFYFAECFALLPAFGEFTGNYIINPGKEDRVFVVTKDGKVFKV